MGYAFALSTRYSLTGMTTHPLPCVGEAVFSCANAAHPARHAAARKKGRNCLRDLRLRAKVGARTVLFIVQSSLQLLWGCVCRLTRCVNGIVCTNLECVAAGILREICGAGNWLLPDLVRATKVLNHR